MTSVLDTIKKKRQEIADKKAGSKNPYRFKQSSTKLRILPSWRKEDPTFYHDFGQMFIKDMEDNVIAVIGDRSLTFGENDPVRDLLNSLRNHASTEGERNHYKEMLPKQEFIMNALILNDKEVDPKVPQIVKFSQAQFDLITSLMEKIYEDGDDPLSFSEGFNLEVEKEGTGLKTRYKFAFERKPSSIDESVMEEINDIDAFVRAKFADSDRAINALKSMTESAHLAIEDRSESFKRGDESAVSYGSKSRSVEADDGDFEDITASAKVEEPIKAKSTTVTEAELDELLADL